MSGAIIGYGKIGQALAKAHARTISTGPGLCPADAVASAAWRPGIPVPEELWAEVVDVARVEARSG
jgi:hypothetical protein